MSELPVLELEEQRILGSLLEKQSTVPASYPLTANALQSACNQTSNREPVVDFDQQTVERTARRLKERELLRIVWSETGRRTLKYHQTLMNGCVSTPRSGRSSRCCCSAGLRRRASCAPAPSGCMRSATGARSRRVCVGWQVALSHWCASSNGDPGSMTGAGPMSWDRPPRRLRPSPCLEEWFGHEVDLDVVLQDPTFVVGIVEAAGLVDIEWYLRGPVNARGETTQRLYVVGRKPR